MKNNKSILTAIPLTLMVVISILIFFLWIENRPEKQPEFNNVSIAYYDTTIFIDSVQAWFNQMDTVTYIDPHVEIVLCDSFPTNIGGRYIHLTNQCTSFRGW